MQKLFIYLALILFITSCGQDRMSDAQAMGIDQVAKETSTPATTVRPAAEKYGTENIHGAFLPKYPAEVTGCNCRLFLDGQPTDPEHYFFVFNKGNGGNGFIGINNERLEVAPGASLSPSNSNYDSYFHENSNYKVQTSLTNEGPAGENGDMYSGKVKVTNKQSGELASFMVLGYCGC